MCIANLNVTTQPCSHRWYKLVRPCSDSSNLTNCPQRLRLEGWETKNEECPWCSPPSSPVSDIDDSTHKLFGGASPFAGRRTSESSTSSICGPQRGRSITISTNSSSNPTSRSSSQDGDVESREIDWAERNRMMNRRLEAYMVTNPTRAFSDRVDNDILSPVIESPCDAQSPISRSGSMVSKGWKRSMKMSRGIFKG